MKVGHCEIIHWRDCPALVEETKKIGWYVILPDGELSNMVFECREYAFDYAKRISRDRAQILTNMMLM